MNIPKDIISQAELGSIKDGAVIALIDTCRIGRASPGNDGQGGDLSWTQIATGVPCRLFAPRRPSETRQGGTLQSALLWKMQLPLGTDLQAVDQVEKDGQVYEVVDTDAGLTYAIFLTAFLVRAGVTAAAW